MYYTSNVSYKKTKMLIDFFNIGMAVVIAVLFISAIVFAGIRLQLITVIFIAGALVNALSALKAFLSWNHKSGIILLIFTVLISIMAAVCWNIVMR